jgi:hypothetical protein
MTDGLISVKRSIRTWSGCYSKAGSQEHSTLCASPHAHPLPRRLASATTQMRHCVPGVPQVPLHSLCAAGAGRGRHRFQQLCMHWGELPLCAEIVFPKLCVGGWDYQLPASPYTMPRMGLEPRSSPAWTMGATK